MKKRVISSAFALIMLLSFTACEKEGQSSNTDKEPEVTVESRVSEPLRNSDDKVFGKWEAESGPALEISTDGQYSYYLDNSNVSDNYYKGPAEIKSSVQALADLKLSTKEYLEKYDKYAGGYYNMFSLKLHYETFQSEGVDKSDTLDKAEYKHFIFMLSKDDEDKARLINMADSTTTDITRVK